MKKIFLIFPLVILLFSVNGQVAKYSNEFLAIGVGARSLAMANAQTASVNDVTAAFWNPAGLVHMSSSKQIGLMHAEYFAGVAKYDYAGFAMDIDTSSTFAVSLIRFGIDDIPNTLDLYDEQGNINYDRISKFSAADYAALFSYSRKSRISGLSYGANVKIIYRQIGSFAKAYGFGLDAGIQYSLKDWRFGATGKDITSTFNAWTYSLTEDEKEVLEATGNELPENSMEVTMPRLILGAARYIRISKSFSSLVEADFDITFDGKRNTLVKSDFASIDPHLGVEVDYKKIVFLRAGIGNIQEETDFGNKTTTTFQPNIGIGIRIRKMISIDYALTDIGDNSIALYSNVFSLRIDLGNKE
ncbi:MAG: PorV/PorQ family protein [Bacteroidetes bacterium]|nr:PorV/PorQ family protein [Bacteroidota bacterium]